MPDAPKKMKSRRLLKVIGVLAALVAVVVVLGAVFWVAPTPPMFDQTLTLASAESQAEADGKFVLAVSTANWCALCQVYKRGALADERVESWAAANAVAVYAKVDEDPTLDARLGVEGKPGELPVTTLLKDGQIVRQHEGVMTAEELLAFLEPPAMPAEPATPSNGG